MELTIGDSDARTRSTDDLKSILMMGDIELTRAQAALKEVELKLQTGKSQAFPHESEKGKLEKDLDAKIKAVKKLEGKLRPLQEELAKRTKSSGGQAEARV